MVTIMKIMQLSYKLKAGYLFYCTGIPIFVEVNYSGIGITDRGKLIYFNANLMRTINLYTFIF